jgi:hypothetical protein
VGLALTRAPAGGHRYDGNRDYFAQARSNGFDAAAFRQIIRFRDAAERDARQAIVGEDMAALGDLANLPTWGAASTAVRARATRRMRSVP